MQQWWKKTVFYQIYMPSFCDGNGDGIGDFKGILSKLPYLKKLGIGGIWLTPFYPSPKVDQGYDISDYYNIDSDYGTMEDFEAFIQEAHRLGIKVVSDIVINHTSTEHEWFKQSKSGTDNEKRDWYIWRAPKIKRELKNKGVSEIGAEPNNWESFFGEKAWAFDETTNMYYYHSFAKEQADLNWANPEVKSAVFEMLDFWAQKGIDGFRLDVINNLTLTGCMKDNPYDEGGKQLHQYDVNQPGLHELMKELKAHFCGERPVFLVGEISSDRLEVIHSFVGEGQLDTTFNFNLGSQPDFHFERFFSELSKMTALYKSDNYPTIFFGSHDMPRFPSRFHFDGQQAKTLFTLMMTYRAIPFIYFGDEIGMENYECESIDDARDVQGVLAYRKALSEGKDEAKALRLLNEASRDHSRNTMFWDNVPYGGFSSVKPWIGYQKQPGLSAEEQMNDETSLFNYVAALAHLRSTSDILCFGDCVVTSPANGVICCRRRLHGETILSVMNFSDSPYEENIEKGARLVLMSEKDGAGITGEKLYVKAHDSAVVYIK